MLATFVVEIVVEIVVENPLVGDSAGPAGRS